MASLIEELQRREAAARHEVDELRGEIARLGERLARAEERLSRLVITRETVAEILGGAGTGEAAGAADPAPAGSPIGVVTVPPWRPGLAQSVLPPSYRDLLEVLADAGRPLRAGSIAAAAGLSTDKSKIEGLRSKLKRLAERGWLAEDGPGLFALPRRGAQDASHPPPGSGQAGSPSLGSKVRTKCEPEGKKSPMKTYDTAAPADPFARSRTCFESLAGELAGGRAGEMTHDQLEELIGARGRELERRLLQDHLDLRALREEQALPAGRDQRRAEGRSRVERDHERALATVFGPVTVRRLAWRAPGRPNLYPADAALSLPAGRHSHGLARLAVREAVRGSYDTAKTAISTRCGPVAGKRQLEQLVQAAAADIDGFYAQRIPMPCTSEVLLVLSADSKGIVMRPDGLRPATRKAAAGKKQGRGVFRTRLASGEKPCRKRMAALACVYDAAPAPRRPHDVIAVPGGRSGQREARRGPHAEAKWLTGSVARDAAEVIAAAFGQAGARDPARARTWVMLVDGDRHQIELIQAEAARRAVTVHLVLDLVHVLEYLWAAAWCFHARDDPAAEDWVAVQALAVLAGRARQVTAFLTAQAAQHGLTGNQRAGVDACARYLTNNEEYLRYDQALAAGWPIATGVIEGAARHLIGDRLDITGSRWGLEGAEAILRLRAVIDNGDYPDVHVMPTVPAGPAGGRGLRGPRDRDNLRPHLR
jgi:hypothetical protein